MPNLVMGGTLSTPASATSATSDGGNMMVVLVIPRMNMSR